MQDLNTTALAAPSNAAQVPPLEKGFKTSPDNSHNSTSERISFGLSAKIIAFLALTLLTFAAIGTFVSSTNLRDTLRAGLVQEGKADIGTFAEIAPTYLASGDTTLLQTLANQKAELDSVSYVWMSDREGNIIVHTFAPFVPESVVQAAAQSSGEGAEFVYRNLETNQDERILQLAAPILDGQLGTVYIGMNLGVVSAAANRGLLTLLAIFGAITLVTIGLAALFANRIVTPIRHLVTLSSRVGQGDLATLADIKSKDEIGLLAQTFNTTIVRLRDMVRTEADRDEERRQREALQANISSFLDVATDIADGDLTKRGVVTEDALGNVVDAINVMIEEFGILLRSAQETAASVAAGSDEMVASSDAISSSAQLQAGEAQRAQSEVQTVVASIQQTAQRARDAAVTALSTLESAEAGQKALDDTLLGMQAIRTQVAKVATRATLLGQSSQEISEITDAISDFASQTNLLALSAALEAAGAGESGRRFAVVAEEVGLLAERSAEAAERITRLVSSIQKEVGGVVSEVEAGVRDVEKGYEVAAVAGRRLGDIATISRQSAQVAEAISESTRAQVTGVEQVGKVVTYMAELSAESQTTVLEGREVAARLRRFAEQLTQNLVQFRVG